VLPTFYSLKQKVAKRGKTISSFSFSKKKMSLNSLYPHTETAEDQPMSRAILITHVVHRGLPIGATIGALVPIIKTSVLKRPSLSATPYIIRILKGSATGTLTAGAICFGVTLARMNGQDDYGWRDRSWRLLENKYQCELDDFSVASAAVGGVFGARVVRGGAEPVWRGAVGGAGLGTLAGVVIYMGWRHGVNGGKFKEDAV